MILRFTAERTVKCVCYKMMILKYSRENLYKTTATILILKFTAEKPIKTSTNDLTCTFVADCLSNKSPPSNCQLKRFRNKGIKIITHMTKKFRFSNGDKHVAHATDIHIFIVKPELVTSLLIL